MEAEESRPKKRRGGDSNFRDIEGDKVRGRKKRRRLGGGDFCTDKGSSILHFEGTEGLDPADWVSRYYIHFEKKEKSERLTKMRKR